MPLHPFDRIAPGRIRVYAVPIAGLTILLFLVIDLMVKTGPGWLAFSDLTLCGSAERAGAILSEWSSRDRVHIAFVNGVDYLFGPLYANLLALGCVWTTRVFRQKRLVEVGSALAWIAWLVLLLDVPENLAYLSMVRGNVDTPWPQISASFILLRTLLVSVGLAYIASGGLVRMISGARS